MNDQHAMSFEQLAGEARVVAAGDCPSFWQPVPANGYAEVMLDSGNLNSVHKFSMGRRLVPPGCRVRLHAHDRAEEVFYVLSGSGLAGSDEAGAFGERVKHEASILFAHHAALERGGVKAMPLMHRCVGCADEAGLIADQEHVGLGVRCGVGQ